MRSLRKKITEVSSLCAQDPMSGELPPLKPRLHWCLWMKYYIGVYLDIGIVNCEFSWFFRL